MTTAADAKTPPNGVVPAARGTVLVIDDDALVLRTVVRVLGNAGLDTMTFADADAALAAFDKLAHVRVALVDVTLPGISGLEFLERVKQLRPHLEIIMMTGGTSLENAVRAMKKGAYDYLPKPFDSLEKLVAVVGHALERSALIDRNSELEHLLSVRDEMSEIIGKSPAMMPVFDVIAAVADTPATVLVTGESGTGKELVARALHRLSRRRKKGFVAINCGAFTESLLDSELFGHQKGAFTGANANRRGVFESAHEATLFLDEVGELAPGSQVRLLRALQEGEIKRVGGNETIKVDVRIVAATNVDLKEAVQKHTFREDLYDRLNVVAVHLPPLRDRVSDIPALAMHMLKKHAARMDRPVESFSDAALGRLCAYGWKGNVRELDNCVAYSVVLAKGARIEEGDLRPELLTSSTAVTGDPVVEALPYAEAKKRTVEAFERRYLRAKLKEASGNISRAADAAGMDRSNFKRLCRSFAVDVDDASGGPGSS
jgi:two-component system response regulator HydG